MTIYTGTDAAITFEVEYRAEGYSNDDLSFLRQEMAELGPVRTRAHTMPAAGGSTEIWMIISFFGTSAASGIIGHLATQFFLKLVSKLKNFSKRKTEPSSPQYEKLCFSYDDLDIELHIAGKASLERLPQVMADIAERIISSPIRPEPVHRVTLPMEPVNEFWRPYNFNYSISTPRYPYRYWLIQARDVSGQTQIYDARKGRLIDISEDDHRLYEGLTIPEGVVGSTDLYQAVREIAPTLNPQEVLDYSQRARQLSEMCGLILSREGEYNKTLLNKMISTFQHMTKLDMYDRTYYFENMLDLLHKKQPMDRNADLLDTLLNTSTDE